MNNPQKYNLSLLGLNLLNILILIPIYLWIPSFFYSSMLILVFPLLFLYFKVAKLYWIEEDVYDKKTQLFYYFLFFINVIIFFGGQYILLHIFDKSSFQINSSSGDDVLDLMYFSVVTIATVGYGDIIPVTRTAKLLVSFEIFTGIFMLILIVSNFHLYYRLPNEKQNDKPSKS